MMILALEQTRSCEESKRQPTTNVERRSISLSTETKVIENKRSEEVEDIIERVGDPDKKTIRNIKAVITDTERTTVENMIDDRFEEIIANVINFNPSTL